ncbi:MAG: GreA/GreB family elongation factor [Acidimicrobiia bacterium]|nr:GreA/GreB family elongation factor [Acidimicrobiia bacterium]
MSDTHVLSPAAYEKLSAELEDLTTRGRIEIARAIERARELGDLSENGDYQAAKDQQGMMEGRIRQLSAILKDVQIAESVSDGKVANGSVITIVYEGDDDEGEKYLVGHIEERIDGVEVITPGSPLGSALLGHTSGETVSYEANGRTLRVTIKSVEG